MICLKNFAVAVPLQIPERKMTSSTKDLDLKADNIFKMLSSPEELSNLTKIIGKKNAVISIRNTLLHAVWDFQEQVPTRRVREVLLKFLADLVSYPNSSDELFAYLKSEKSVFIQDRDETDKYILIHEFENGPPYPIIPRFEITFDIEQEQRIIQSIVSGLWKANVICSCSRISKTKAIILFRKNKKVVGDVWLVNLKVQGDRVIFSFKEVVPQTDVDRFIQGYLQTFSSTDHCCSNINCLIPDKAIAKQYP